MNIKINSATWLLITIISGLIVLAQFALQSHVGLDLSDEGFLWYGSQRTLAGEVPGKDFMAYGPARYYWSATTMYLLGDNGIIAQRAANSLILWLGLLVTTALFFYYKTKKNHSLVTTDYIVLLLSVIAVMFWMVPSYKMFDLVAPIFLIGAICFFLESPRALRALPLGLWLGLSLCWGLNHALYSSLAFLALLLYVYILSDIKISLLDSCCFFVALIVGLIPQLYLVFWIFGYWDAFIQQISGILFCQCTNLTLPVPWPWTATGSRSFIKGVFFLALPVAAAASLLLIIKKRAEGGSAPSWLIASACSMSYIHYAFSRADIAHLALGIFPALFFFIISTYQTSKKKQVMFLSLFLLLSSLIIIKYHPYYKTLRSDNNGTYIVLNDDRLLVDQRTSDIITLFKTALGEARDKGGESFLIFSAWSALYAIENSRSPTFDTYMLMPLKRDRELVELERIKAAAPNLVLMADIAIDNRDDLRVKNMRPVIYDYLVHNYVQINPVNPIDNVVLFERRHQQGADSSP